MALLPRLVGESRLGPANALLHTVQDLGVVVGPAIGAVLLAVAPASVAFLVNARDVRPLGRAHLHDAAPPRAGRRDVPAGALVQIGHGLRIARATPFVVPLFVVVAMVEFTYGAQTVQLVLYAERSLDLGRAATAAARRAGAGGLLSAIVNGRLASSTGGRRSSSARRARVRDPARLRRDRRRWRRARW